MTDARAKLLDYGRPALQYIRDNATPRIADTFHLFLLSLYESLAQAATVPKPRATPAAPPPDRPRRPLARGSAPRAAAIAASRFGRPRSRWSTLPSRPIRTLAGISVTP